MATEIKTITSPYLSVFMVEVEEWREAGYRVDHERNPPYLISGVFHCDVIKEDKDSTEPPKVVHLTPQQERAAKARAALAKKREETKQENTNEA